MDIKVGTKETTLKFTFNSFKYMQEFDPADFALIEDKPMKIVPILEMLLLGSMNNSPKLKFSEEDVVEFMDSFLIDGDIGELTGELIKLLEDSSFFKALQKK